MRGGISVNPGPAAPPTTAPVRRLLPAMRGLLMAFCVLTALGFGSLFVLSGNTDRTFAWTIAAAWLIAFGGTAAVASLGDLERLRSGAAAYTTLRALVLIGVARFPGTVRWNSPTAWVFMATAAAAVVTGVVGWRMAPAPARAPARAPAERA